MMAKPLLFFLGDSHLRPPLYACEAGLFGGYTCEFESVGGATAVGLRHPLSKTQALSRFLERLLPAKPHCLPIFQLGEVDCGFLVWLRAQRHGEDVEQQVFESLVAYRMFLKHVRGAGYDHIVVTSAMPPTIRDGDVEGEVHYLRREVKASWLERSRLTKRYNEILSGLCEEDGYVFVNLSRDFVDPSSGLLREEFRSEMPGDHHLHNERAGRVWAQRILGVVSELGTTGDR